MSENPADFRDLLNQPLSDFPDMPNLPGGKYFYGKCISFEAGHSRDKGTPLFHLGIRTTDPGKDVPKADIDRIAAAGFSLSDYTVGKDFYLTPKSMIFLRRFLSSLGFPDNQTFRETLRLNAQGEPTPETVDLLRGRDVIFRTPPADDNGRVFTNNVDMVAGVKEGEQQ